VYSQPNAADEIRFCLIRSRARPESPDRDALTNALLARAMIEARRDDDGATETTLIERFGFTAEELRRHGEAARDKATVEWLKRWPVAVPAEAAAA
jgi:hypothetical protein